MWGAWLGSWGNNPWVAIKASILLTAMHPHKHFYSLSLIKARTSPGKTELYSNLSLCSFKAGMDENCFGDGKGEVGRIGVGA